MEKVVHCKKAPFDIYIGRPSKWGNPFTHKQDGKTLAKYIVGSRDEAIEAYREWITNGEGKHLLNDLHELKNKVLGCWCKPLKCHGDILSELASKQPNMKIIIAGGRDFNNYDVLSSICSTIIKEISSDQIEIVSGKAKGADALGERFAKENNLKLSIFPANWDLYGKSAGYKRNEQMANYADALIAFWNGNSKGTKHMIDIARNNNLQVFIKYYDNENQ